VTLPHAKPPWLKVALPGGEEHVKLKSMFRKLDLSTVCEEARCPNIGECWREGTATLMLLGDTCTRGCRFCAVKTGDPRGMVDPREPEHVARAIGEMKLGYVVLTMVDRDDLLDGGAAHVSETVQRIRVHSPDTLVETLVGDFGGQLMRVEEIVQEGKPDVYAHNVEVVPRLQRTMRDVRCSFERSLGVLEAAHKAGARVTKTSLMLGCGEEESEVLDALQQIRAAHVSVVTMGQYLRPTPKHAEVQRYVPPEEFERLKLAAEAMGFAYVASGPLVRSSYRAAEAFLEGRLKREHAPNATHADRYGKRRLEVLS
jgi:lipoyl synthase